MRGIFVVGTDTGVGKTVVTGCLARYFCEKGRSVITQKWVQTGCDKPEGSGLASDKPEGDGGASDSRNHSQSHGFEDSDIAAHLKITGIGMSAVEKYLPYMAPYIFKKACSPHLASGIEEKRINARKIIKDFNYLSNRFDLVVVEGTGGALVPFSKKHLMIEIARELNLPVIIVAANKLGAINHTLLTIEALKARKTKILGIIFNNAKGEDTTILKDNPRIIKALSGENIFGALPWEPVRDKLYKKFEPIGKKISKTVRVAYTQ